MMKSVDGTGFDDANAAVFAGSWPAGKRSGKGLLGGMLALAVLTGCGEGYGDEFGEEVHLGSPITSVTIPGGAQGKGPNGEDWVYVVANGNPAVLSVLDAATGELAHSFPLPGVHGSWALEVAADQTLYIGTNRNGRLYRWVPGEGTPESVSGGRPFGQTHLYGVVFDGDGVVYAGTYPDAKIVSYNPRSGEVSDRGRVADDTSYARHVAWAGGYLYVGTQSEPFFIRYDPSSGEGEKLSLPEGYAEGDSVTRVDLVGDYLFVRVGGDLNVYDHRTDTWINRVEDVAGFSRFSESTPESTAYFVKGGQLYVYDLDAHTASPTGASIPFSARSFGWIELEEADYPGRTLVAVGMRGDLFHYNPSSGKSRVVAGQVEATPISIRSLSRGPDGNVYIGGYLSPREMARFDPDVGEIETLAGGAQIEAMTVFDGKLYLGRYPGASVLAVDPGEPWDFGNNPSELFRLGGYGQDRPFGLTGAGGRLAVGTVPESGKLGGALALYDPSSGEIEVYEDVIENQSIVSLAYRDGFLYGGTSVWGGLGIDPAEPDAKLFVWDVEQGERVWEGIVEAGERAVTALAFDRDGMLWGLTSGKVFQFDPNAREVVRVEELYAYDWPRAYWQSGFLEYDEDRHVFYGTTQGRVFRFDPATWEVTDLVEGGASYFARDRHGNIYFARGTELHQLPRR